MTLRRKLFVVFFAFSAIALLVTGVALFLTLTWQTTTAQLERHYQRSLLLQQVRAGTYQALKEVDDALTDDHIDARDDFERALRPARQDFSEWSSLADTPDERAEVARVEAAHDRLINHARQVFELIPKDRAMAIRLLDDEIDTRAYEQFRLLTEEGVQTDQEHRRAIAAETYRVRTTAQVMLAVSAFSILSLIFLLAAYLTHDWFRPLKEIVQTLDRLKKGDLKARAQEGGNDELGDAARSLNQFAALVSDRIDVAETRPGPSAQTASPQAAIYQEMAALEAKLSRLKERSEGEIRAIVTETETIAHAVGRWIRFCLPIDLDLSSVDLPALIYSILSERRAELVQRAVSLEVNLTSEITRITGDRLRLREALNEIVGNAVDGLPEKGGRLGLRTVHDNGDPGFIRIEIADDGEGLEQEAVNDLMGSADRHDPHQSFAMVHMIAARHGGKMKIFSEVGRGTVVQLSLPI